MDSEFKIKNLVVTILAAGEGKRMNSKIPKVLCLFKNKPMLIRIIQEVILLSPRKIVIIVGKNAKMIKEYCNQYLNDNELKLLQFILQKEPKGTGHAICSTLSVYNEHDKVLILNGDMPNITANILERFLQQIYLNDFKNTIITIHVDNPYGYGRIVLEKNKIVNIVEEKDASEEERKINLINTGIYCFDASYLSYLVPQIENNNIQKEYYLTDIVKIGNSKNITIHNITLLEKYNNNVLGVNTKKELESLELNAM